MCYLIPTLPTKKEKESMLNICDFSPRRPTYGRTAISSSTGCRTATVRNAMNVATASTRSDADTIVVSVDRYSVVAAVTRKSPAKSWAI